MQNKDNNPESTFNSICQAWLKEKKRTLRESSIAAYENKLTKYILPYFEEKTFPEADVLERDFMGFLEQDKDISDTSVKEVVTVYRAVIKWYKDEHNAPIKREETQIAFFANKEFETIEKNLSLKTLEIAVLMYTGMTLGELSALEWRDCDLVGKVIKVSKTQQRVTDSTPEETSKTRLIETNQQAREVPISEKLLKLLKQVPKSSRKGHVAESNNTRTIQNHITSFLEQMGYQGNPSKFRDTFAIKAIKSGANLIFIAKVIGITPEVFTKRYHEFLEDTVTEKRLRQVVDLI